MKRFFSIFSALALALAIGVAAGADQIKLKNGRSYEGEIVEQTDDYIMIRVSIGSIAKTYTIWANDVESIVRDSEAGEAEADQQSSPVKADSNTSGKATRSGEGASEESAESPVIDPNHKRVFFIPMHEGVGDKFRKDKLELAVAAARRHKADIIVLEIDSPGGALSEVYKLRDYLTEIRNEFRIVSWIKSAISAAAMTAINTREIYFMNEGHMGAATAWYMDGNQAKSLDGEELEYWLETARRMAKAAGHSPLVAQAMIKPDYWLTADRKVLPTGEIEVTFYDTDQGEFVLCEPGEILTVTASEAERFGISLGTADTEAELAEMLNLDSWVEVSDEGRKLMKAWWALVDKAQDEIPKYAYKYDYLSGRGAATERERRRQLGERANIIRELIRWLKCDPAMPDLYPQLDLRSLERELEDIQRQLGR